MNSDNFFKLVLFLIVMIIVTMMIVKRFVYFNPSSNFTEVTERYTSIQNKNIHGWILDNDKADKIVLFCHGNAGNISHRENKYISLRNLGCVVVTFDYSGYGKSGGIPSEQQLYDDASAMASFVINKYPNHKKIVYGESIGGPVATYVARKYKIPIIILDCPLPSIKELIKHKYPTFKFMSFLFPEFDTVLYLDGYKGKSLLLHSHDDEIIPYDSIMNLQKYVTKHIMITGTHNRPNLPWSEIENFIQEV